MSCHRAQRLLKTGGALLAAAVLAGACSSSKPAAAPSTSFTPTPSASPAPATPRPAGPAAQITGPVTAGNGIKLLSASALRPSPQLGQQEYFASGTAVSYTAVQLPSSGAWTLATGPSAAYRTRIIVRTPKNKNRFNGTVYVEWLNVSVGSDTDPDYTYAAAEIERTGAAYVGVSAQKVGISGSTAGDIASQLLPGAASGGLRKADPVRYGSLNHPGDAYSYDMFTQVARALRSPGRVDVLGGLKPARVIALGESQSASRMVTYVNGVQPLTHEFDAFFVHSRGGGAAPLTGDESSTDFVARGPHIRTDTDAPVLIFETETDIALLRYDLSEQPDSAMVRVWEVAGTSHADSFQVGGATGFLGCGDNINAGPQVYVVRAALSALDQWVRTGRPPASAPRFEHTAGSLKRSIFGIALGGIRTPPVDVPISVQSGVPADASKVICALFGSSKSFDPGFLKDLYGSKTAFVAKWDADLDRAIAAGHLLTADRMTLLADGRRADFG